MAVEVVDVLLRAKMEASEAVSGVGQIQKALQGLTLPKNISADLEKSFGKLGPLLKDYQKQLDKGFSNQKDLKNFNLLREKIDSVFSDIQSKIREVNGQEIRVKTDMQAITKMEKDLDGLQSKLQDKLGNIFKSGQTENGVLAGIKALQDAIPTRFTNLSKIGDDIAKAFNAQNYAEFNSQIQRLQNNIVNLGDKTKLNLAESLGLKFVANDAQSASNALIKFLSNLQVNKTFATAIEHIRNEIKALVPEIEQAKLDSITNGLRQLEGASGGVDKLAEDMHRIGAASEEAGSGILSMKSQVEQLKTSTQYFFSLRNMLNLLKRGVDDAVQSIKELDKAMTDTAVVTDFTVGDMWKDLPKYTQLANELGATTQGAYETMTLYYQQGLNQEQAFALGAETMKMARIAGLDYAETTDMMTAALRGFNMELDETSAKRVNDVYSKLAAITASDTEELGTAMQRTASIAHSAGMSFEGTTAFLAQAIETTREPAENLGTAMKTIVARFQEMKENPLEITEVDGEEVSYNKVDKALQSIGVSLKDTNGQFRELDQVFLDISQRWDGLTQTQQRYIATTAAGSRQQSRFIAMMDNYERTVQLFSAANDSAGASDEQFGKTADSLEFKLNKLHNAWQQFTMSIMNDSWTKGFVSAGTAVLNIVNDIINKLSFDGQNKGIKSFLSVITAFTALKTGGRLVNSFIGGLGGLVDPTSSIKEGFKGGFLGGRNQLQAERISNPIVKAIYNLIPHIDKAAMPEGQYKFQDKGNFNKAYSDINKMLSPIKGVDGKVLEGGGKYSFNQLTNIIDENKLDKAQQKLLFRATPGLKKSVINNLSNLFKKAALNPEVGKGLIQGFESGNLALDEILTRKEFTQSTLERAKELGGESGKQYKEQFVQQAISKGKQQGLVGKELGQFVNQQLKKPISEGLGDTIQQLTPLQKVQNAIGNIGGGLMTAGSSLQMFGAQLAQTNPILGQFVSGLGNAFTSIGSLATALPALMNPATLAIGAVAAAFAIDKFKTDKIKKAAEEIDTSFKDTSKTTQDNIANLKAYREELATLSKGVDQNGNNINLSDADYSRYLEIVDSIAEMNPEIVQGYNAQGHAIIDNNEALEQTLNLQKQIQKEATEEYLNPDSLQTLINARNINKDYKASTTSYSGSYKTGVTPLTDNVISVAKELKKSGFDEAQLEAFGIHSLDSLIKGEEQAVRNFVANQDKISSLVSTQLADGMGAALTKSFDNLSTQTDAYEESIKPIYEWLSTSVSQQPLFEELPEQVRPALQKGLQAIAGDTKLTAKQMTAESNKLLSNFRSLTVGNKKYTESLKTVKKAQEDYADSLNETQYKTDVQPAIDELNRLKESAENMGTAAGDAVAEYLQNQIAQISRFTEEGSINITEALNGAIDDIAAAEGALEEFSKATEKDFWTASEGMRSIYDKMFETYKDSYGTEYEKHTEGEGDNTFWEGARALLSEDKLTGGVDEVGKRVKNLEPILREGQEGVEAFYDKVVGSKEIQKLRDKGLIELDEDWFKSIPEEQWANVAKELGISENLLTAMLNKARQFGLISFDNLTKVREALSTDNRAIEGLSSDKSGKKALYMKEDTLRAELAEAGYNSVESQDKKIAELQKEQNIKTVQTLDKLDKTMAKDLTKEWGISNLPDLITKMSETGEYNKEEILDLAEKAGLGEGETASDVYDKVIQALENPELAEQTSELRSANSKLAAIQSLIANGGSADKVYKKGKEAQKDVHQELFGKRGTDTQADYFKLGQGTDGNLLSAEEYTATKAHLQETQQSLMERAAEFQELAKMQNEGDDGRFNKLAQKYIEDANNLQEYINSGTLAWEKGNKEREEADEEARRIREDRNQKEKEALESNKISGKEYQDARYAGREQEQEIGKTAAQKNAELAQTYLNNLNESFSSLFGNLDPAVLANNPQALGAAELLSKTVAGEIIPTPEDINTALGTLGVEQGSFAYNKFLQFVTDKANQINSGAEDAVSNATPTEGSEGFNSKVNTSVGEWIKGLMKEPDVPTIDPKADSGFREKVQSQIKNWLNNLTKAPEVSEISPQQPQQSQQPSSTSTFTPAKFEVDTGDSLPKLQEVQTEGQKATDTVNTTATFDINTPGINNLIKAADAAQKLSGATTEKTISVKTGAVDQSSVKTGVQSIKNTKANIKVGAETQPALQKVESAKKTIDSKKANIDVSANFTGSWSKEVSITVKKTTINTNGGATGINNHIQHRPPILGGSLAKGTKSRYGQVGPQNRGGLTLTGEKGFEIAWIPSENRSMIVGATGPQMVDLPSDAVVWTHEQSKKILQRQTIPAGSHSTPASGSSLGFERRYTNNNNYSKQLVDNAKKAGDKVAKTAEDTGKAVVRVLVWWDNAARRAEAVQRKVDKNQKEYEKYLKEIQSTLKTTGTIGQGNDFIANTQKAITEYQRQYNRATTELNALDTGSAAKTNKGRKKQYAKGADNIVEVSYKKGKKQKTAYMNTAGYIYQDANGAYQIDQQKINKIKNKDQRKAFYEAAKKELDDRISKQNAAEDNIQKAQEALEKFSEELYNTFFAWENELTKIWNITQQIEQAQSRMSGRDAFGDLLEKQLSTGMLKSGEGSRVLDLDNFKQRLKLQNQALEDRQEAIKLSQQEVKKIATSEDEKTTLAKVNEKLNQDAIRDSRLNQLNDAKAAKKAYDDAIANRGHAQGRVATLNHKISRLTKKKNLSKSQKKELASLKKQKNLLIEQIKGYDATIKDNEALANKVDEYQKSYDAIVNTHADLNETERAGYEQYKKELEDQITAQDKARQFTKITRRGDGTIDIEFNSEAFEKERLNGNITSDMAKAIQDWVKKLEEASKNLQENYESLTKEVTEYYNQLEELQDAWANYGKELTDISEAGEKERLDRLKQLYDSIKKALDNLLAEVKRKLDERRQQEDNAKTERDISQKQQRLAALRADTSGGHQVEIAQLEKEISEAQINYQHSLEDQLLDKLQQQADEASKQRERQIELQEALVSSVSNIEQVNEWMERATAIGNIEDEEDRAAAYEELKEEIRGGYYIKNDYDSVTKAEQDRIAANYEQFFNGLITNQTKQQETVDAISNLKPIIEEIRDYLKLQSLTLSTAKDKGKLTAKQAQEQFGISLSDLSVLRTEGKYDFEDFQKSGYTNAQIKQAGFEAKDFKAGNVSYADAKALNFSLDELEKGGYTEATEEKNKIAEENRRAAAQAAAAEAAEWLNKWTIYRTTIATAHMKGTVNKNDLVNAFNKGAAVDLSPSVVGWDLAAGDGTGGVTWKEVVKAAKKAGYSKATVQAWWGMHGTAATNAIKNWSKYKTGGLADYTGPAWLDGTPSKPELVLNAVDTKNFLALRDVLSGAIKSTSAISNSYGGDIMYDINIHVDKIEKDYDVDRVVDKVKKEITKGAGYRNVTQVRKFR